MENKILDKWKRETSPEIHGFLDILAILLETYERPSDHGRVYSALNRYRILNPEALKVPLTTEQLLENRGCGEKTASIIITAQKLWLRSHNEEQESYEAALQDLFMDRLRRNDRKKNFRDQQDKALMIADARTLGEAILREYLELSL